jgi:hypothetical protein
MIWKPTWRRHWRWRLLAIFLGLLALSHFVQWARPPHGIVHPGQRSVQVPTFDDDDEPTGESTSLYYYDLSPDKNPDTPVVVLIHGSPGSSRSFDPLALALKPAFRLIIPASVPPPAPTCRTTPPKPTRSKSSLCSAKLESPTITLSATAWAVASPWS